jgi:exosortase
VIFVETRSDRYVKFNWFYYLPIVFILGWWLLDLQFQWRALVDYQYGWIVVLLAFYLVWERWPSIPDHDRPASLWICSALVLLGTPFVLAGELYKQAIANTPTASFSLSIGCLLYLFANVLYLHGWKTLRHFFLPLTFLFLAVPLPGFLWNPVVLALKGLITALNVETLNLIGIPAEQRVNVIQLPRCEVGIDDACSGVRSLQSSIMAGLFIGNLMFKRMGSRWFFVLASIVLALGGNFLRSLYLALTAHWRGVDALKGLHDTAGWSVLIFSAIGLIVLAWLVGRIDRLCAAPKV